MRWILLLLLGIHTVQAQQPVPKLWYRQPAKDWLHSLPLGNGRLGAMVQGNPQHEVVQINEESVWAGIPFNDANPNARKVLDSVRQLLFAGKNEAATALAAPNMIAVNAENSTQLARSFRSYQTLMNLHIGQSDQPFTGYYRELDLFTGVATSRYELAGVHYTREAFISAPANVVAIRIRADRAGQLQLALYLDRRDPTDSTVTCKDARTTVRNNQLLLSGHIQDRNNDKGPEGAHMKFAGAARVFAEGGKTVVSGDTLNVSQANGVVIYIDGATNYDFAHLGLNDNIVPVNELEKRLGRYRAGDYDRLKAAHVADHRRLMERVKWRLGPAVLQDTIPTDERLAAVKRGAFDPWLTSLYFQYGRYLLMGSSRSPGVLPANLQGIWNYHLDAPWQADFHTNINLQMNYWHAEVTALPETTAPLFAFLDHIRPQGRITARKMYGARGWVMHHATDAFGKTGLQNAMHYGTFPMATAWMCLHFWEHYLFTGDTTFLRRQAYPIMKEHAEFLKDFLVKSPEGYMVTVPAYSPENLFKHPVTGKPESLTYGPTMDNQIAREFLQDYVAAAHLLHADKSFADSMQAILAQLPPTRLGKDGRILEWIQEYEETEPGHRHISHLFGLHPGTQINDSTPALLEGARKTLAYRLAHGGGHTGWSRAWIINFYARLKEGDKVQENMQALLAKSTYDNLFDNHPPFQIDGNFGGTAGLAEAMLQSNEHGITLLPALPAAWSAGAISGLHARGGYVVDMEWEGNRLQKAWVRSILGGTVKLYYEGQVRSMSLKKGERREVHF
ncbi:glycoside hydrolase family 95 protein [Chitinophaga pendula]|uniref:glycoside hydrolase family 95 protein n=1 Tax=Chitinophaga TaxID=79328 RepID=UPI000BB0BEC6|nr:MULTISPECIES: glycoside hydrolase family 95 protein [Chitinophaga]ASZ11524.1 glycoside hydrolase [Chitinophaga sp. MD30]UCJ05464.1 glycoside hydrolase family 95 protein [Chitinophaga pendula]